MNIDIKNSFYVSALLLIMIVLTTSGCQRPRPLAEPLPEPGIFSGKTGEMIIFDDRRKKRRRRR
jgi:hypothetical protein